MKAEPYKILVVEDETALSKALSLKLKAAGLATVIANDGKTALGLLEKDKFNLILLDLIIPKLDGWGVLEELSQKDPKIPVIVSSNLGQPEDIAKAKKLGAVDYIIKSETPIKEVVEKVIKYLKQK